MALQVGFVQDLREIVEPVAAHLNRDVSSLGLFETQHVIVPTAGVRAWLVPQLARRLGASNDRGDGIVSNVRFGYVGALNALLRNGIEDDSDAWSIDHITMAVLRVISHDVRYESLVAKHRGSLRAARAIADRFDRYAARRPQMIRAWERGSMMIPGVNVADAEAVQRFAWQYDLWREVRTIIGVPSWPARSEQLIAKLKSGDAIPGLPRRLMVAGLESISASSLEVLVALGNVIEVEALFVHPSPALRELWSQHESAYTNEEAEVPKRNDDFVTPNVDVLVSTWTRGSFELQMLLASQGISAVHVSSDEHVHNDDLLNRLQRAVADPSTVQKAAHLDSDHSVQIHRAHNLARQVEVLHDAVLHAFTDFPDLEPHEVLVLCADIEAAAPLLQATFERSITLADGRRVTIPFVVADRSLRDVSAGAELLEAVLKLVESRFDLNSVLQVATSQLILDNFGLGDSDVATWIRLADLTRVRWGVDTSQRKSRGLDAPAISAHTWLNTIERALVGALVPDAPAAHELGGVVPLAHIDVADVSALSGLVGILAPLAQLEAASRAARSVSGWCDAIEGALVYLCGESCTEIDDALEVLSQFRRASVLYNDNGSVNFDDPVSFSDFAELVSQLLTTAPGRQPLRTGAVTATSFVPLRSVPFRVVCILGLDDGTLPGGDAEGDDLVATEPYMGDSDPRLEVRRVVLDAVLAAHDRLIVTCIGRSIKNNSPVPLVTPLAELVDLCGRLGVTVPAEPDELCSIEHLHPRHLSGVRNFINTPDAVIPGMVWSHDSAARTAAEEMSRRQDPSDLAPAAIADALQHVVIKDIEDLVIDPLGYYLSRTLRIYPQYDKGDDSATLPTKAGKFDVANAAEALDEMLSRGTLDEVRAQWRTEVAAAGLLPVDPFAEETLAEAETVATKIRAERRKLSCESTRAEHVRLDVGGGVFLEGDIDGVADAASMVTVVKYSEYWEKEVVRLAVRLLVLCAAGSSIREGAIIHRSGSSANAMVRTLSLDPSVTAATAVVAVKQLLGVETIARSVPCALFGDTASLMFRENASSFEVMQGFENFVEGNSYDRSNEIVVFGDDPGFDIVYGQRESFVRQFFEAYFSAVSVDEVEGSKKKKWVVSHGQ